MEKLITCFVCLGISLIYSQPSLSHKVSALVIHDTQHHPIKGKYSVAKNQRYSSDDADFYYKLGVKKSKSGDKKEAITDFNTAIIINPKHADAYFQRGAMKFILAEDDDKRNSNGRLVEIGDRRPAIRDFDKAIALKTKYLMAYQLRGYAKAFIGDTNAAISDLNEGAELSRKQGDIKSYEVMKESIRLIKLNVICLVTCPDTPRH
jgi:tetratricopeptide (TPR) repeat protein